MPAVCHALSHRWLSPCPMRLSSDPQTPSTGASCPAEDVRHHPRQLWDGVPPTRGPPMQSRNQWAKKTNGVPPLVGIGADGDPAMAAPQSLPSPARRAARAPCDADAPPRGRSSSDAATTNVQYGLWVYGTKPPRPGAVAPATPSRKANCVPRDRDGGREPDGEGAHRGSANGGGKPPRAPRIGAVLGVGRYSVGGTVCSIAHKVAAGRRRRHPALIVFLFLWFVQPDTLLIHPSPCPLRA